MREWHADDTSQHLHLLEVPGLLMSSMVVLLSVVEEFFGVECNLFLGTGPARTVNMHHGPATAGSSWNSAAVASMS